VKQDSLAAAGTDRGPGQELRKLPPAPPAAWEGLGQGLALKRERRPSAPRHGSVRGPETRDAMGAARIATARVCRPKSVPCPPAVGSPSGLRRGEWMPHRPGPPFAVTLALILALTPTPVAARGKTGHRVVAMLAMTLLTPEA